MTDPDAAGHSPGPAPGPAEPDRSAELARLAEAVRAIEHGSAPPPAASPGTRPGPPPHRPAGPPPGGAGGAARETPPPHGTASPGARAGGAADPGAPPAPEEPEEAARAVLRRGGAPPALAGQAVGLLGDQAGERLTEDPWEVLRLPGVRPDQADAFARGLLGERCRPDDERRSLALVGWLMERAADAGHTALAWPVLAAALGERAVPEPEEALRLAVEAGRLMVFREERDPPAGAGQPAEPGHAAGREEDPAAGILLALDRYALAEESLADGLVRLLRTVSADAEPGGPGAAGGEESGERRPEEAADETEGGSEGGSEGGTEGGTPGSTAAGTDAGGGGAADAGGTGWAALADRVTGLAAGAVWSASAAELARAVAGSGLVAHSGGQAARAEPAALVGAARAAGLRAYAAVWSEPDRRAAAAGTGEPAAVTVDGLLSGAQGPGRGSDGAWEADLIAVLDAERLDVEQAAALVEAVPDGARLVLSGDPGRLWSAGAGRVLADLLASKACPRVASRTPDEGPIGELVSGLGVGELAEPAGPGREVVAVPVRDPGEAVHRAVQLVADSIPRAFGLASRDVRVIAWAEGGPAGAGALNAALKERLNPGPGRFAGFDPGDAVLYRPAPGEPGAGRPVHGRVAGGDPAGLRLDCGGGPVLVPPARVPAAVRHGWAVAGRQAAGGRAPAVVVVLPDAAAAGPALTRQWLYSAFGGAERHLSVVHGGAWAELARVAAERPARERTTRLRAILREQTEEG